MPEFKINQISFNHWKHENTRIIKNDKIETTYHGNGSSNSRPVTETRTVIEKGLLTGNIYHVTSEEHVTNTSAKAEVIRTFKVEKFDDLYDELTEKETKITLI